MTNSDSRPWLTYVDTHPQLPLLRFVCTNKKTHPSHNLLLARVDIDAGEVHFVYPVNALREDGERITSRGTYKSWELSCKKCKRTPRPSPSRWAEIALNAIRLGMETCDVSFDTRG